MSASIWMHHKKETEAVFNRDEIERLHGAELDQMAVVDRFIHIRVLGLSKWLEPARKEDIYEWPSLAEFSRALMTNRMNALENEGLIKTTENYVLPKDQAVCNEAAHMMMKEVLHELESA